MDKGTAAVHDLEEVRLAGEILVGLLAPADGAVVAISLEHLLEMHREGKAHVAKIAGPQSVIRKAMREAWRHGIRAPLARSRDIRARGLLAALPDVMELRDLAATDLAFRAAAESMGEPPEGLVAHLARARAYLDAAPVLLAAVDGLDDLPRAFVPDAAAPRRDNRGMYAARRLRQAFARDVAPLVDAVAAVAHRETFGCVRSKAFARVAAVLADVPAMGVRRRDPSGVDWAARMAEALAEDVVAAQAVPLLERLFSRFPGVVMDRAGMRREAGFAAALDADLSYGNARLALTHRFNLADGSLAWTAVGRMVDGPAGDVAPHMAVAFLADLTGEGEPAQAATASGRRTRASVPAGR